VIITYFPDILSYPNETINLLSTSVLLRTSNFND